MMLFVVAVDADVVAAAAAANDDVVAFVVDGAAGYSPYFFCV